MNQGGAKIHAVLWHSAGSQTPAELVAALNKQGITWEEAIGPYDALARLLAQQDTGYQGLVLLLIEPPQLSNADEVRAAIERFNPATGCWAYRSSETPHLAPLAPPAKPIEPEIVVRPAARPQPKQQLKLAGNGTHPQTPQESPRNTPDIEGHSDPESPSEPESARSLLTPEELEMLLADNRE